jgi:hypothetical protein
MMMWNFSCRKTRRLLALSAGSDLEGRECASAQRHLAVCPRCREVWQGLVRSQRVLERVSAEPAPGRLAPGVLKPASIWPGIQRHLQTIDAEVLAPDWRGWLPSGALAAACLAIVMVALPDPPGGVNTAGPDSPMTIRPQPVVGAVPRHSERHPVWIRESPEFGNEFIPQPPEGRDQPRSF